jgi:hypothetical protein
VLDSFGPGNTGHVFNLGHGISQFTPPDKRDGTGRNCPFAQPFIA